MPGFDTGCLFFEGGIDPRGLDPVTNPIVNQMSDGKLLIGSNASPYVIANTLTAGAGIGITNGSGNITITNTFGGFVWNIVTSLTNPNNISIQTGYIPKGAAQVIFVLPPAAAVGACFQIAGYGNLWTIHQNALQTITLGNLTTSAGIGGSMTATHVKDCVHIVCVTANTEFQVTNCVGNPSLI